LRGKQTFVLEIWREKPIIRGKEREWPGPPPLLPSLKCVKGGERGKEDRVFPLSKGGGKVIFHLPGTGGKGGKGGCFFWDWGGKKRRRARFAFPSCVLKRKKTRRSRKI